MVLTTKMGQASIDRLWDKPSKQIVRCMTIQMTKLVFNVFFVKECSYLLAAADIAIVGHMISNGF